jgi:protein-S-isoprenylcysteine O-methyltransferase Ste14
VFIAAGFYLIYRAWQALYQAQHAGQLATEGPYRYVRHPQYAGFILILFGFLLQWPTILTLAMFPTLVVMYIRLARIEERESERRFGDEYRRYAARTPAFIPEPGGGKDISRGSS